MKPHKQQRKSLVAFCMRMFQKGSYFILNATDQRFINMYFYNSCNVLILFTIIHSTRETSYKLHHGSLFYKFIHTYNVRLTQNSTLLCRGIHQKDVAKLYRLYDAVNGDICN